MRYLEAEQSKIPAGKQIMLSPVTNWSSTTPVHEAPHLYRRWPTQYAHDNHHLLVTFASYNLHCCCNTHKSQGYRQWLLQALLNTFGTCHKTHTMTTRYEDHDTEDIPATQDSASLDLVPPEHPIQEEDNESSDENCEETNTCSPWLSY